MQFLHDFFDRQWQRWADRVAVEIPPGRGRPVRAHLTYAELAGRSAEITRRLHRHVAGESVVLLLLPRTSVWAFAAQLGVLRAGAAYVSLDPSWPAERMRDVVADANPTAVITDEPGGLRARDLGIPDSRLINVDALGGDGRVHEDPPAPRPWLTAGTLAYLIYTSGTSGRPKGVMIEHRAIVNLIAGDLSEFSLTAADRVGHGSSHGYDSSLEEIWLAWSVGGTVVVLDDDAVRAGPDLVPWLARERVSVLCPPPTLLRTLGGVEASSGLPGLRLVYVGGEALPADVAAIWSVGRRLVNGYGPTECAVTSLRIDIVPGAAISIGRPIPGIEATVLDANLADVVDGANGELCLSGTGLARGYWNAPDLTAAKFPHHARLGRIYRTGDLVHRDGNGRFFYHGRIDAQVKLRGHRIELEEIEAHLCRCPGVRAAACRVDAADARQVLLAFVVPSDAHAPPSISNLRSALGLALPGHMIPGRIRMVPALPATIAGKLDRDALREVELDGELSPDQFVAVEDGVESSIERAMRSLFRHSAPISAGADFFLELSGDSLRAAELVTALRQDRATASITVRDVYEAPTIRGLAARIAPSSPAASGVVDRGPERPGRPVAATVLQAAWISAELSLTAILAYIVVFKGVPALLLALGLIPSLLLAPILLIVGTTLYAIAAIAVVALAKRLLVGRYEAVEAPVWSAVYLRHWAVQQAAQLVPWGFIAGGEFHAIALRVLGARIGRRVHIHRGVDLARGGWDLLEIGDDVSIGQDAELRLVDLAAGRLIIGPITLGSGVTIETRAGLSGHTQMKDGASLAAHSWLAPGQVIPPDQRWDGIPATPAAATERESPSTPDRLSLTPFEYSLAQLASHLALTIAVALPAEVTCAILAAAGGASASDIAAWIAFPRWETSSLLLGVAAGVVAVGATLLWQALLCRAMGRVAAGVIDRWSRGYLRVWMKSGLVESAGNWLSGTLMWPIWLRAAGMSIGRDCEISTVIDVVPEQVTVGDSCFLADGIYLGGPRIHRGSVTIAPTRLEEEVFLGNHAVIPAGATIGRGVLIGISTVADARAAIGRTSWFGHPPFELARRPAGGLDRRLTHEPGPVRYANRLFWEALRFAIPLPAVVVLLGWIEAIDRGMRHLPAPMAVALIGRLATALAAAALCTFVLALKWLLLGRVAPAEHPLWSCWCSRWDFLYVAWAQLARPVLAGFEGTLLLNIYLRAMGARLGRRVVLGPGSAQMVDPDMLTIEDGATVHALFQAHTFEDRILKIDRIRIGRRATVGSGVVLLYGSDIGDGTSVAAHSVVMKRERLSADRAYVGYPTREA